MTVRKCAEIRVAWFLSSSRSYSDVVLLYQVKLFRRNTSVPGAGNLCLGVSQFKSSSCCKYMQTDVGVSNSIVWWIVQRLIAQEMLLQDLVFSIGVMVYSFPKSVVQLFAGLLARAYFFCAMRVDTTCSLAILVQF